MKSPSFEFLNECDRRESTRWIGLVICLGWPSRVFCGPSPPGAPRLRCAEGIACGSEPSARSQSLLPRGEAPGLCAE